MQLQKLSYISYCWNLTCYNKRLFISEIQKWDKGPVIKDLYYTHEGMRELPENFFSNFSGELPSDHQLIIDGVLDLYGQFDGKELSLLIHKVGSPWDLTTKNHVIDDELIKSYYLEHFPQLTMYPITKNVETIKVNMGKEATENFLKKNPTYNHRTIHYLESKHPSHKNLKKDGILTDAIIKKIKQSIEKVDNNSWG